MRSSILTAILVFGAASAGISQSFAARSSGADSAHAATPGASLPAHIDFAINYLSGTNDSPGAQCPCKGLSGAGFAASYNLFGQFALMGETDYLHSTDPAQNRSMTLASYMGGAKYTLPYAIGSNSVRGRMFVRAMAGKEHAGGGTAGVSDHTYAFATRIGGGLDLPLRPGLTVRMLDVSYQRSTFQNSASNSQNNVLMGFGVVYSPGAANAGHLSY